MRAVSKVEKDATYLRLHIGLEAPKDLIADLDAGFTRFRKAL
jgi:cystathionine beta-lyase/cystathionine gamma-synthase